MTGADGSLRLLLADDHPIVLSGLEKLLSLRPRLKVIASVTDGLAARDAIQKLEPDIALLDINMPKLSGLEVLEYVERKGSTRIILLTASAGTAQITRAAIEGAWGIMLKDFAADALLQCIDTVAGGERWLPLDVLGPAFQQSENSNGRVQELLTPREQQIARLVAEGLSNKHIGRRMGISEGTVKIHLHNIYNKLDVSNRTSLATLVHRTLGDN